METYRLITISSSQTPDSINALTPPPSKVFEENNACIVYINIKAWTKYFCKLS